MPRKPAMVECPHCNGTGTIELTIIYQGDGPTTRKVIPQQCDTCNGTKTVTRARQQSYAREKAYCEQMWCRCEGDVDVEYFEDGEHEEIEKHHWRCKSCGKVRQIG